MPTAHAVRFCTVRREWCFMHRVDLHALISGCFTYSARMPLNSQHGHSASAVPFDGAVFVAAVTAGGLMQCGLAYGEATWSIAGQGTDHDNRSTSKSTFQLSISKKSATGVQPFAHIESGKTEDSQRTAIDWAAMQLAASLARLT